MYGLDCSNVSQNFDNSSLRATRSALWKRNTLCLGFLGAWIELLIEKVTTSWSDIPSTAQTSDIKSACVEKTKSNVLFSLVGEWTNCSKLWSLIMSIKSEFNSVPYVGFGVGTPHPSNQVIPGRLKSPARIKLGNVVLTEYKLFKDSFNWVKQEGLLSGCL